MAQPNFYCKLAKYQKSKPKKLKDVKVVGKTFQHKGTDPQTNPQSKGNARVLKIWIKEWSPTKVDNERIT